MSLFIFLSVANVFLTVAGGCLWKNSNLFICVYKSVMLYLLGRTFLAYLRGCVPNLYGNGLIMHVNIELYQSGYAGYGNKCG